VAEFFPLGSGMGSYPDVMRAFYPSGIGRQINHAHNDYIEWLFEGGLLAALLVVLFLVLYLVRWRALWAERNWHSLHMMQVGAGVGLLLILLHGLTDYNLRIPANLIYAAFLAGVFFRTDDSGAHHHRKPRHADAVDSADAPAVPESSADAMQAGTADSPDAMAEPVPSAGPTHVQMPPEPEPPAAQASRKRNPFDA
jgi:O-antigen ligase